MADGHVHGRSLLRERVRVARIGRHHRRAYLHARGALPGERDRGECVVREICASQHEAKPTFSACTIASTTLARVFWLPVPWMIPIFMVSGGKPPAEAMVRPELSSLGPCEGLGGHQESPRVALGVHARACTISATAASPGCSPTARWGWSNAGLVVDGGAVAARRHALRPAPHRARCSTAMRARCRRRARSARSSTRTRTATTATATQLVAGAEIIASRACRRGDGARTSAGGSGGACMAHRRRSARPARLLPRVLRRRSTSTGITPTLPTRDLRRRARRSRSAASASS